jgi:predicted CopG family antitoxin
MATTTIVLERDAYERLRLARLHGRESFSSVVRRARWPEKKHTAAQLLAYMTRRARAGMLLEEAALDRLEAALARPRRSASRWGKA